MLYGLLLSPVSAQSPTPTPHITLTSSGATATLARTPFGATSTPAPTATDSGGDCPTDAGSINPNDLDPMYALQCRRCFVATAVPGLPIFPTSDVPSVTLDFSGLTVTPEGATPTDVIGATSTAAPTDVPTLTSTPTIMPTIEPTCEPDLSVAADWHLYDGSHGTILGAFQYYIQAQSSYPGSGAYEYIILTTGETDVCASPSVEYVSGGVPQGFAVNPCGTEINPFSLNTVLTPNGAEAPINFLEIQVTGGTGIYNIGFPICGESEPTSTLAPTPTETLAPFAEQNDCTVPVYRIETPVAAIDPVVTEVGQNCYTIIPQMNIGLPDVTILGVTLQDINVDETDLCVHWMDYPDPSILGITISFGWIILIPLAWFVRRLLSF